MKKSLKTIRYVAEYLLLRLLYIFFRLLPWCGIRLLSKFFGTMIWCVPSFRRLIAANIACAMPELPPKEMRRIGRASCYHLILNMLEFVWLSGSEKRIHDRYVLPENITAELKNHVARGERIIFVNPHLGSWEASGLMAPYYAGVRMVAIAKPIGNPYINNFFNHGNREKERGLKIIFARGAIRAAVKALREGMGVGTLIDQNTRVREGGTFVNFFGVPVASSKAPASLLAYCRAHQLPAVIIYGTSVRRSDGRVEAHSAYLSKDFSEYASETELIQELMNISEGYIRRYPDEYLWLYQRFKYIPPDTPEDVRKRYPYYARQAKPSFFSTLAANEKKGNTSYEN